MRAVYCDGRSIQFREDLPEPCAGEGEVVLDVRSVGICDTDLQLAKGYMNFRGVLGHEFVGVTEDGRRVTAEINNPCLRCPTCRARNERYCPNRTVLGILNHDGAMADRVCVPSQNLHIIPDTIDDHQAVFIEPLAAAFRITEQVDLWSKISLAVLGDGKLGILCAWVARSTGAEVFLIGKHPEKLVRAGEEIRAIMVEDAPRLGRRFDVVVDCTGSQTGLMTAVNLVRPNGVVVLKTTVAGEYCTDLSPIVIDEVRVVGSRCGPFPKAIAALAEGEIDVRPLISAVFPLTEAEAAFKAASGKRTWKVLIDVKK